MDNSNRKLEMIGGVAGIVFAVLFILGALFPVNPDIDKPAQWVKDFGNSGDRTSFIVAGYMWVVSGLAMAVLVVAMWRRLGQREGMAGLCAMVGGVAALAFSFAMLLGGALTMNIAGNISFGGADVPSTGDLIAQLTNTGGVIVIIAGGLASALALTAVSTLLVMLHGPRWLAVLGYIAAICAIFGAEFVPMIAVPIWVLIAAVVLLIRRANEAAPASTPAPAT